MYSTLTAKYLPLHSERNWIPRTLSVPPDRMVAYVLNAQVKVGPNGLLSVAAGQFYEKQRQPLPLPLPVYYLYALNS